MLSGTDSLRNPKMKVNRIGGKDATGDQEWKKGGNPVLFQHALKQLNIPADEAIAFGNEICDAQAASNAGIKAYHCLWGAKDVERDQILADPIIPASPPRSRSSTSWNKPPRRYNNYDDKIIINI